MKYEYRGPVPVADGAGELVHPLDVRDFDEAPDCPPWQLLAGQHPGAGEPATAASDRVPGAPEPVQVASPVLPVPPVTAPKGM